jgi:hypothetical protein
MKRLDFYFLLMGSLCIALAMCGCAHTTLYRDGQKIAAFQGDMTGIEFYAAPDGAIAWKAETVDHSSATLAQGEAAAGKIQSGGAAVAASGLTLLLK